AHPRAPVPRAGARRDRRGSDRRAELLFFRQARRRPRHGRAARDARLPALRVAAGGRRTAGRQAMKRQWILCAALVAGARVSYAGGVGTIEGSVVNPSGNVVAAGTVQIAIACGAVHRTVMVDGSGHFSVSGLPEGTCTVTGTGSGFVAQTFQVAVA